MQSSSTGPQPPTGLTVVVTGGGTAAVSWESQQSMVCDVVIGNYSVRYQLRSSTVYTPSTTLYTPNASVTLPGLACDADYTVSVAAINSKGEMSSFSAVVQFTVTSTAPPPGKTLVMLYSLSYPILTPVVIQLCGIQA